MTTAMVLVMMATTVMMVMMAMMATMAMMKDTGDDDDDDDGACDVASLPIPLAICSSVMTVVHTMLQEPLRDVPTLKSQPKTEPKPEAHD